MTFVNVHLTNPNSNAKLLRPVQGGSNHLHNKVGSPQDSVLLEQGLSDRATDKLVLRGQRLKQGYEGLVTVLSVCVITYLSGVGLAHTLDQGLPRVFAATSSLVEGIQQ